MRLICKEEEATAMLETVLETIACCALAAMLLSQQVSSCYMNVRS